MRSRRIYLGALIVGVCVGLLMTAPISAQSVGIGNALINVEDAQGDRMFDIGNGGSNVRFGSLGADVDLYGYEVDTGAQTLWFNNSLGDLFLGGSDSGGSITLRNTANANTVYADGGSGDLYLGLGTTDGDLVLREGTTGIWNMSVDGNTATAVIGAHGAVGDAGTMYLRDADGVTNNISLRGIWADINLGSLVSLEDGDISLSDGTSSNYALDLEGSNGTITNKITGNGVVKAWAQINSTGTVSTCYRCNASVTQTQRIGNGVYEVDFTIATDIGGRPVLCSTGHNGSTSNGQDSITCVTRGTDPSSMWVVTTNDAGTPTDSNFTIVVF